MSCVDSKAGGKSRLNAASCDERGSQKASKPLDRKELVLELGAQPVTESAESPESAVLPKSALGLGYFSEAFGKSAFDFNPESGLCRSVQSLQSESASTRLCANGLPPAVANTGAESATDDKGAALAVSIDWQ